MLKKIIYLIVTISELEHGKSFILIKEFDIQVNLKMERNLEFLNFMI